MRELKFSLPRLFNVEITVNIFNFIAASFSEIKVWVKRFSFDFDYTRVSVERFNSDIIGSKFSLAIEKDLSFGMFKVGTTLKRNWLNVSQRSSSLDMVLPSSTRLIFSLFDKVWVNNGKTVLQKLQLAVIFFRFKIFQIRFFSVFQKFFYIDFFGAVVFLLISVQCSEIYFLISIFSWWLCEALLTWRELH